MALGLRFLELHPGELTPERIEEELKAALGAEQAVVREVKVRGEKPGKSVFFFTAVAGGEVISGVVDSNGRGVANVCPGVPPDKAIKESLDIMNTEREAMSVEA
ncbi:hypothetical protein DRO32_05285 [Candidatus Bathyarchaeota archaeon]|nr:MAG: hypothetical protein DRO32_05285 [Candidatus Bathyarchaeota archaeon]